MKRHELHYQTFKKGSKTYFNSSLFFPAGVRQDVFILYGFVRVADNFVDAVPQQKGEFYAFKEKYLKAREGTPAGDLIIDSFVELSLRKNFKQEWSDAFLYSMELDLKKNRYQTLAETLEYIYGSAEVIGLFMARLLGLKEDAYHSACLQGRAMQYINFIRDINEDLSLGRIYLPLSGTPFRGLAEEETRKHPEAFREFISGNISRYLERQQEAARGYAWLPRRYLAAIKTASDMYNWTALQIRQDPFIVYRQKVKPSRGRILRALLGNLFYRPSPDEKGQGGKPALHHQYQLAGKEQGFADPGHYGQAMAVCAGDIAFFSAFQIISAIKMPCHLHREIMRLFVREFIQVGLAQMKEVQLSRLKKRVREEDIYEVYTYKTGRYTFSLPLMLGAMAADQEPVILEQFSRLGEYIGLIFQIRDDELGLFGESRETGKPVGSDIREAKQTIYYCKLFKKAQPEEKIRLQQIFGKPELNRQELDYVLGLINSLGVRQEVNLSVAGLQRKSEELLGQMTFLTPWGRRMFEQLFAYNLNREK